MNHNRAQTYLLTAVSVNILLSNDFAKSLLNFLACYHDFGLILSYSYSSQYGCLIAEARVRAWISPCVTYSGQSGTGSSFSAVTFHCSSYSCVTWRMNNRPFSGRSSVKFSPCQHEQQHGLICSICEHTGFQKGPAHGGNVM
jgi:hypothetical protein